MFSIPNVGPNHSESQSCLLDVEALLLHQKMYVLRCLQFKYFSMYLGNKNMHFCMQWIKYLDFCLHIYVPFIFFYVYTTSFLNENEFILRKLTVNRAEINIDFTKNKCITQQQ